MHTNALFLLGFCMVLSFPSVLGCRRFVPRWGEIVVVVDFGLANAESIVRECGRKEYKVMAKLFPHPE